MMATFSTHQRYGALPQVFGWETAIPQALLLRADEVIQQSNVRVFRVARRRRRLT
jgi:hypothetical protein